MNNIQNKKKAKLVPMKNAHIHNYRINPYDRLNIAIPINQPSNNTNAYQFPLSNMQQDYSILQNGHIVLMSQLPPFPYLNPLFYYPPQLAPNIPKIQQTHENAATKIQKLYRGHLVRKNSKTSPSSNIDLCEKNKQPILKTLELKPHMIYGSKTSDFDAVLESLIALEVKDVIYESISGVSNEYLLSESAKGIFDVLIQEIVKDYIYMTLLESTCELQAEEWLNSMVETTIKEILYEEAPKVILF
jgi:hypothetical protein